MVTIVIPVFNKSDLTVQCLKALADTTRDIPHEVIVVDNASTDNTAEKLKAFGKEITYLRNRENLGFARACNQGAAAGQGGLILFLNNDTIPLRGWLEPLVREMQQRSEVAAVGSRLLYRDGSVQHAGVAFERETRIPYHPHRFLRSNDPRVNHKRDLQAVTAACMLIRRTWFDRCGKFCEEYRNGYEDLDLCLQIRKRGGVIVYQPQSVLYHLESQTEGRMKHDSVNCALFYRRWYDALLADEDAYYVAEREKVLYQGAPGNRRRIIAAIESEAEARQWKVVARCQQLAAEGRTQEVVALLQDVSAWPSEPSIRQWAAVVSTRLLQSDAAAGHWAAIGSTASSVKTPKAYGILKTDSTASSPSDDGLAALVQGSAHDALAAFDRALQDGLHPRAALQLEAAAALLAGDKAAVEQCAMALLSQQGGESLAKPLLAAAGPASVSVAQGAVPKITLTPADHVTAPAPLPEAVAPTTAHPQKPFRVSIIILVLNQLEHTRKCLDSLAAYTPESHEIIVVDNGSTDGSADYLKEWQARTANTIVIRNRTNRGFAAGNNQALSIARGETVLLLNNDTVVTPEWLTRLLAVFDRSPDTGILGPMSNRVSGPQFVPEVAYADLAGLPAFAQQWARAHDGQTFEVDRAVGFCLLARREVIAKIGGLDERFGSGNFEDDDFCLRAKLAGFRVLIAQDVFIHHTGSQTFKGAKIDYRAAMMRNWELFRSKWQLDPDTQIERGYRTPKQLPAGTSLEIPLPDLLNTHRLDPNSRLWNEQAPLAAPALPCESRKATAPKVAALGETNSAEELWHQGKLREAWERACTALKERPFHPEACLLLAEIAAAAGDSSSARRCAQKARDLAPKWKPAKKFLKRDLAGKDKPEWLSLPEAIQPHSPPPKPTLSVCLIVKNEEKFIEPCLNSIKGLANQIVLVDTGSTDRTVEIARKFGAELFSFAWCDDFSAARNAALEHATGDWILTLDADEELPASSHEILRQHVLDESVMAWRLPIVDAGREADGRNYIPRLFRNAPGVFFAGRVHEHPFAVIEELRAEWGLDNRLGEAVIVHHGYTKALTQDRDKVARNLRLLEMAMQETPGEPLLMMSLGLELCRAGRTDQGLQRYDDAFLALSRATADQVVPEFRETLLTQYASHLYAARRYSEVVRVLTSPLAAKPGLTASQHYLLGMALLEQQQYAEAGEQMRLCITKRMSQTLTPALSEVRSSAPRRVLALCLARVKNHQAAEKEFQAALAETPHDPDLQVEYAQFLHDTDRLGEALQLLHKFGSESPDAANIWICGARITLAHPELIDISLDWTTVALQHLPQNDQIVAQRAEALMLSGQLEPALPLWMSLAEKGNPSVLAAIVLCETALKKNTFTPAAELLGSVENEFTRWLQQLVAYKAETALARLFEAADTLSHILPLCGRILSDAVREKSEPLANS